MVYCNTAHDDFNEANHCCSGQSQTCVCLYIPLSVCASHLKLCQRNDVTSFWAIPDGLLGNSVVVVVLVRVDIQQLPPLVIVHRLTEGRGGGEQMMDMAGRRGSLGLETHSDSVTET